MFLLIFDSLKSLSQVKGYFNTSHVSINLRPYIIVTVTDVHFNTSHVSINHGNKIEIDYNNHYFNTSHVSINPAFVCIGF